MARTTQTEHCVVLENPTGHLKDVALGHSDAALITRDIRKHRACQIQHESV